MTEMGLLTHIGAHGEPPLGLNYHAEMWFSKQGGLSNYDVRSHGYISWRCFKLIFRSSELLLLLVPGHLECSRR